MDDRCFGSTARFGTFVFAAALELASGFASEQLRAMNRATNKVFTGYGLEKRGTKHLDQIQAPDLSTRLELLRNSLRPTPDVPLAMKGMNLFARLEYVNPVGQYHAA